MEDYSFEITNALGDNVNMTCLATVHDNDNNQDYLIYTDNTFDAEGDPRLFISEVIKNDEGITLEPVEDYEEINAITKEIDKILASYN